MCHTSHVKQHFSHYKLSTKPPKALKTVIRSQQPAVVEAEWMLWDLN